MQVDERAVEELAAAWIALHLAPARSSQRKALFWAFVRLSEWVQHDPEAAWSAIEAIRRKDSSDVILSNLGAGPLEDLLAAHGDSFIVRIEAMAGADAQLRTVLGAVWRSGMSEALWSRIRAVAAPSW